MPRIMKAALVFVVIGAVLATSHLTLLRMGESASMKESFETHADAIESGPQADHTQGANSEHRDRWGQHDEMAGVNRVGARAGRPPTDEELHEQMRIEHEEMIRRAFIVDEVGVREDGSVGPIIAPRVLATPPAGSTMGGMAVRKRAVQPEKDAEQP